MKRLTWLYVGIGLLVSFVVVPKLSPVTLEVAGFVTRYIPPSLAPFNWALGLFLIAVCEGPLLKPKYLSFTLKVLLWACILFFLGSWNLHPIVSPVISVLAYIEMNWLIPLWEAKVSRSVAPPPEKSESR